MNIGIFVCTRCAGLHRELHHKAKGLAVCVFNNDELAFLTKWGNEVSIEVKIECEEGVDEKIQKGL